MENERSTHRSTDRLLDILEQVAEHPGELTLSEISAGLDIPKSTISPILHTLTARGYLSADVRGRYAIGASSYLLGWSFLSNLHFLDEVERILDALTAACMETSHFAMLSEGNILYLKKAESPQQIRMVSTVGLKLPAYSTALGKALLSDCTREELDALYPKGFTALTPKTVTDLDVFFAQLQEVRRTGFAYESEESNEYICCIAAPVRKGGRIVAAVSVATPVFRYNEEKAAAIRPLLLDACRKIEKPLSVLDIDLSSLGL